MPVHLITVHGLNTINPWYYKSWVKEIPNSQHMKICPVKWKSWSWEKDLFNIYMSKIYRDQQIQKIIDEIKKAGNNPILLISHSWGTVWTYKAWHRLKDELKGPIWSVMVGAALGGTNLPFGSIYVDAIKQEYSKEKTPENIERLFNLYNNDDYISSRVFIDRMENFRIDTGGFNPGFQEHNATLYFKTMEFHWILEQFSIKFKEQLNIEK